MRPVVRQDAGHKNVRTHDDDVSRQCRSTKKFRSSNAAQKQTLIRKNFSNAKSKSRIRALPYTAPGWFPPFYVS